jgi:hypothetical protein
MEGQKMSGRVSRIVLYQVGLRLTLCLVEPRL